MLFLFDIGLGFFQEAVLLRAHVEGIIVRQPVKDMCVCVCVCVCVCWRVLIYTGCLPFVKRLETTLKFQGP